MRRWSGGRWCLRREPSAPVAGTITTTCSFIWSGGREGVELAVFFFDLVAGEAAGDNPVGAHEVPEHGQEPNRLCQSERLAGGGCAARDEEVVDHPFEEADTLRRGDG